MNQYRKTNRPLMPTNYNVISPDLATKCIGYTIDRYG